MWKILQKFFHALQRRLCVFTSQEPAEDAPQKESPSDTTPAEAQPTNTVDASLQKKHSNVKIDPCRPALNLVPATGGKPILLIGYYQPDRQEHPKDAWFSHLILYPYARKKSDLLVFSPSACVKDARALADRLVTGAPAQKKYQMLLVVHPASCECHGITCGVLHPAFELTKEPLT